MLRRFELIYVAGSYWEAIDVLYGDATFYFDDILLLRHFLDRQAYQRSAQRIRNIYFDWISSVWISHGEEEVIQPYIEEYWNPMCRRLEELRGLRRLIISAPSMISDSTWDDDDSYMAASLKCLQSREDLEVSLC